MPTLIPGPAYVEATGNKIKVVEEFVGRACTGDKGVSIARMRSPEGWISPGQKAEFDEFKVVLKGILRVEFKEGSFEIRPGQAVVTRSGEWARFSTPHPGGADYWSVCTPAFSMDAVERDA